MRGISKRFGATRALDGVSLALSPGEVHALVGENGAGKSTLIKVMTGIHAPDEGTVEVDGEPATLRNAADAQARGIAAIYQEPLIFPDLSVAENVFIGHRDQGRIVRWRRMNDDARAILARLDVHLDPRMPAAGLPVAAQQAIEIAKAISLDVRVLIMDEPTAALSAHEVERLFRQVRQLRDEGVAVLFISHRLDEVFEIADRISVFRDGRRVATHTRDEVTRGRLIAEMVGREGPTSTPARSITRPTSSCPCGTWVAPAGSRASASTCTGARCWAWPGWWAPAAPTWRWRCSASPRPRPGPSSWAAARSGSAAPARPWTTGSPTCRRTGATSACRSSSR